MGRERLPLAVLGVALVLAGCGDARRDPAEAGEDYAEGLTGKGASRRCVLRSFDAYKDPESRWIFGESCQDAMKDREEKENRK